MRFYVGLYGLVPNGEDANKVALHQQTALRDNHIDCVMEKWRLKQRLRTASTPRIVFSRDRSRERLTDQLQSHHNFRLVQLFTRLVHVCMVSGRVSLSRTILKARHWKCLTNRRITFYLVL